MQLQKVRLAYDNNIFTHTAAHVHVSQRCSQGYRKGELSIMRAKCLTTPPR